MELLSGYVLSMCYMPARDSESASRTHQRIAQQSAPAVSPPPALPVSATERVLELSLEQAIQLALQNNLDIERGRYDPQVPAYTDGAGTRCF